jgi:hypothetical protein
MTKTSASSDVVFDFEINLAVAEIGSRWRGLRVAPMAFGYFFGEFGVGVTRE